MKEDFTFQLTTPIKYSKAGVADHEGTYLVIKAPTRNKVLKKPCRKLKRLIAQVFRKNFADLAKDLSDDAIEKARDTLSKSKNEEEEEESVDIVADLTPRQITFQLLSSTVVDIEDCYKALKEILILEDCCKIDGEIPLNDHLHGELEAADEEGVLGAYIKNFLPITF